MERGNVGRSLKFSVKNPVAAEQEVRRKAGGKREASVREELYSRENDNVV